MNMKSLKILLPSIFCLVLLNTCQHNKSSGNNTSTVQTPSSTPSSDDNPQNSETPPTVNQQQNTISIPEGYNHFNGIPVEKFPRTNTDPNRYNADNNIYKPGRVFVYGYYYETPDGKQLLAQNLDVDTIASSKAWQFIYANQINTQTITEVLFTVQDGLGILGQIRPDYNRTTVEINYNMPDGMGTFKEFMGFIENPLGVWIYPPRQKIFGVLSLNPQPYIKAPYEVGHQWEWGGTMVGSNYSDPRWAEWGNRIITQSKYKIIGKKNIDTPIGSLECFEVNAFGENRLGNSQLTAYFNEQYGFVQMNYLNVDGSKVILLLKEVREAKS